ncbi:hypothetical protein RRG08_019167 [Elysia crispata]|uniref:PiggyBac transposable element-derived protein domain-containing protein n=1 Tax=Elysia crispata TaxID=231223 RepID=A0AAE0YE37_9GAST|nr:hypothetical protein RRG08_019167 [Elysia crispata]
MVVGTVGQNWRDLLKDLSFQSLQVGEMDFRHHNQVLAIKWKDKWEVQMLTTKHLPTVTQYTTRTESKMKPHAVFGYTANMGGVDISDQLISYNPMH